MEFFEHNRTVKAVTIIVILFSIVMIIYKFFFQQEELFLPEVQRPLILARINWDLIRKPLEAGMPEFSITAEADPTSTVVSSPVVIKSFFEGNSKGPFTFKLDCDGDGVSEKESTWPLQIDKTESVCVYENPGNYEAKVALSSSLHFYDSQGDLKEEEREAKTSVLVRVRDSNLAPQIDSCDVNPTEGTTQSDFKFNFFVLASDPEAGPLTYEWVFGDGATSSESSPSHTFRRAGFYVPKVTVYDSKGASSSCIAESLLILGKLTPFSVISYPETVGREYPFRVFSTSTEATTTP